MRSLHRTIRFKLRHLLKVESLHWRRLGSRSSALGPALAHCIASTNEKHAVGKTITWCFAVQRWFRVFFFTCSEVFLSLLSVDRTPGSYYHITVWMRLRERLSDIVRSDFDPVLYSRFYWIHYSPATSQVPLERIAEIPAVMFRLGSGSWWRKLCIKIRVSYFLFRVNIGIRAFFVRKFSQMYLVAFLGVRTAWIRLDQCETPPLSLHGHSVVNSWTLR